MHLEAEDNWIDFVQQSADDPGHDHELIILQVKVGLDSLLVHHLQAAEVVALEGFHAFGLEALWELRGEHGAVVRVVVEVVVQECVHNLGLAQVEVAFFDLVHVLGGHLLVQRVAH